MEIRFGMRTCRLLVSLSALVVASWAQAAMLGIPAPNTVMSGVGMISGWKCEVHGELTARFNDGPPIPILYGAQRPDVYEAGVCDHEAEEVGFVAPWNWAELGDGEHTLVVYDDGEEFARSTFEVVTLDTHFLTDAHRRVYVMDFPEPDTQLVLEWREAQQNFVIVAYRELVSPDGSCGYDQDGRRGTFLQAADGVYFCPEDGTGCVRSPTVSPDLGCEG